MTSQVTAIDVIRLGEKLIALDSSEEALDILTQYVKSLDELIASGAIKQVSADEGAKLQRIHAEVSLKANSWRKDMSQALKDLQKKGKGIITYTDNLPKKINLSVRKKI